MPDVSLTAGMDAPAGRWIGGPPRVRRLCHRHHQALFAVRRADIECNLSAVHGA